MVLTIRHSLEPYKRADGAKNGLLGQISHGSAAIESSTWRSVNTASGNNYYTNPDVRFRMIEFLGGDSLANITRCYLVAGRLVTDY